MTALRILLLSSVEITSLNKSGFYLIAVLIISVLAVAVAVTARSCNRLKRKNREAEGIVSFYKNFIDAGDSIIYLKDSGLRYVFVNQAFERYHNKSADEIVGRTDYEITDKAHAGFREKTDMEVLKKNTAVCKEIQWADKTFKLTGFPVAMPDGKTGVGAYIKDITYERISNKRQERVLHRNSILYDMLNKSFKTAQEQMDYVLGEAVKLTESEFGLIYLYNEEDRELLLNTWSRDALSECGINSDRSELFLVNESVWNEAVIQRKAVLLNNRNEVERSVGKCADNIRLDRFLAVPVMVDGRVEAVVGLANKATDYDNNDVHEVSVLMNGAWNALEKRAALEDLSFERKKYLQTLISIGDGVLVVDRKGIVEMLNGVAQRLTGWSGIEAVGRHYSEILKLYKENSGEIYDPIGDVLESDTVQELQEYVMLISRDGVKYSYIEENAAPIRDDTSATIGVVLVFRDVTEKKEQRERAEYLSFHDPLTGLYNRRFFEKELKALDVERNLPISIIMGDVNGLKLTNDIFGHAYGDIMLVKVAEVLQEVCGRDDIIARWGGDEFAILLPNTGSDKAEKIIDDIKRKFANLNIKAIKGSISMGCDTKEKPEDSIILKLENAEDMMYSMKTLERDDIKKSVIEYIIKSLHDNSAREKEHSVRVSELCRRMGMTIGLSEDEVRKLKEAGYLHDIGKIVLAPELMNKNHLLTDREWNEVKRHSIVGYRILNSFDDTLNLAESVLAHHERWNGSGYPKGLKGEEIPKPARVIAIVEGFDRMTHDSDNLKAMSVPEALKVIRKNAGILFDPELAEAFCKMIEKDYEDENKKGEKNGNRKDE